MGQGRRRPRLIAYFDSSAVARMLLEDEANDVIYTQDQNPNEGALFSFSPPR